MCPRISRVINEEKSKTSEENLVCLEEYNFPNKKDYEIEDLANFSNKDNVESNQREIYSINHSEEGILIYQTSPQIIAIKNIQNGNETQIKLPSEPICLHLLNMNNPSSSKTISGSKLTLSFLTKKNSLAVYKVRKISCEAKLVKEKLLLENKKENEYFGIYPFKQTKSQFVALGKKFFTLIKITESSLKVKSKGLSELGMGNFEIDFAYTYTYRETNSKVNSERLVLLLRNAEEAKMIEVGIEEEIKISFIEFYSLPRTNIHKDILSSTNALNTLNVENKQNIQFGSFFKGNHLYFCSSWNEKVEYCSQRTNIEDGYEESKGKKSDSFFYTFIDTAWTQKSPLSQNISTDNIIEKRKFAEKFHFEIFILNENLLGENNFVNDSEIHCKSKRLSSSVKKRSSLVSGFENRFDFEGHNNNNNNDNKKGWRKIGRIEFIGNELNLCSFEEDKCILWGNNKFVILSILELFELNLDKKVKRKDFVEEGKLNKFVKVFDFSDKESTLVEWVEMMKENEILMRNGEKIFSFKYNISSDLLSSKVDEKENVGKVKIVSEALNKSMEDLSIGKEDKETVTKENRKRSKVIQSGSSEEVGYEVKNEEDNGENINININIEDKVREKEEENIVSKKEGKGEREVEKNKENLKEEDEIAFKKVFIERNSEISGKQDKDINVINKDKEQEKGNESLNIHPNCKDFEKVLENMKSENKKFLEEIKKENKEFLYEVRRLISRGFRGYNVNEIDYTRKGKLGFDKDWHNHYSEEKEKNYRKERDYKESRSSARSRKF